MSVKKRVLLVAQEMEPYLDGTDAARIANKLPQYLQEKGMDVRVLMPRFGSINERRHRLHEVVRLSGINIIIDEDDYPLLIKVASLPSARLQVYFLDNEEFFKRKFAFNGDDGQPFVDNADRMIFFCKGVLETVRKFGWAPDVIHCQGWMTSLIPLYGKTAYQTDPIFANTKFIYSIYENSFEQLSFDAFQQKAPIKRVHTTELQPYGTATNSDLHKGAIHYADGVIVGSDNLDADIQVALDGSDKPVLVYQNETEYLAAYKSFFEQLTN